MAEAAVEERPRFYCHMCNVQFQHAASNFTCPHCDAGFIEELSDMEESASNTSMEIDDLLDDDVMEELRSAARTRPDSGMPHLHVSRRYGNRARNLGPRMLSTLASRNLQQQHGGGGGAAGGGGGGGGANAGGLLFEHVLHDLIVNLSMDSIINLGVGGVGGTGAGGSMQWFLGNPGDYAWGREGLDAIVTQLLNQMDTSGPPPLSRETIDALPAVEITTEQVSAHLQCSVCWEDFVVKEIVRRLPCLHVYHEPCIRPWLQLHGTCPICRQNLVMDKDGETVQAQGENAAMGAGSGTTEEGINSVDGILRTLFGPSTSRRNRNNTSSSSSRQRSFSDSY